MTPREAWTVQEHPFEGPGKVVGVFSSEEAAVRFSGDNVGLYADGPFQVDEDAPQ